MNGASRTRRRALAALLAGGATLVPPARAFAQDAAAVPTPGLTLADVLRATAVLNTGARAARQQLDAARGGVAVASAAFDAELRSSMGSGRQSEPGFVAAGADATSTRTRSVDYQVGLAQRLPWGVVVTPQLGLAQVGVLSSASALPTTRAKAGLGLVVPLGRDRLGRGVAAGRRAADHELDAAGLDLRQAAAQAMLDAAVSYWNYAAAQERLDVQRETERRAQLLVDETRALIRADERPAADLAQLLGNLATRRAQRIAAEQALDEARQQLGVVMGVRAHDIAALPAATTPYPAPSGEPVPAAGAAPSLGTRVARRPDVLAAAAHRRAAQEQLAASTHATRPRIDLVVDASYASLDRGFGVDRFVGPLYRNVPGLSTAVQLQFDLPVRNAAAGGIAAQREAEYEQLRLVEADLARRAVAAATVATAALARGRDGLAESAEAVRLARETVDNEKQKFRLGVSTQFDVVNAEEALTSALLAEIAARRGYAAALASLRFAAGDLAPDDVAAAAPPSDRAAAAPATRAAERAAALLLATPTAGDPRPARREP